MIRILIITFLLWASPFITYGQKSANIPGAAGRDTAIIVNSAFAFPGEPTGWTNDLEHILSISEIGYFDSIIAKFEKETSIEITILTIDSCFTNKDNYDSFVTDIGNRWHIGKKGKNNGIIIGVTAAWRKIRISNGYGIEGILSDEKTKEIIDDSMIPSFRKGNFFIGILTGLLAIIKYLQG